MDLSHDERDFFSNEESWRFGPCIELALLGGGEPDQLNADLNQCLSDSDWAIRCPVINGSNNDRDRWVLGAPVFPTPLGFLVCHTSRSCWLATYPAQYQRYLGPGFVFRRSPPDDIARAGELLGGFVHLSKFLRRRLDFSKAVIVNEAEAWPGDVDEPGIYTFAWLAKLSAGQWAPTGDTDYVRMSLD